jgi:ankyrin repeat protein
MGRAAARILLAVVFLGGGTRRAAADDEEEREISSGRSAAARLLNAGHDSTARARAAMSQGLLPHAARAGDLAKVQWLIANGRPTDLRDPKDGMAALHFAAKLGTQPIVDALLEASAFVDVETLTGLRTPLMMAAQQGHTQICKSLLERGAKANAEDAAAETALMLAVRAGSKETVSLLLRHGARADAEDMEGETVRVSNFAQRSSLGLLNT